MDNECEVNLSQPKHFCVYFVALEVESYLKNGLCDMRCSGGDLH